MSTINIIDIEASGLHFDSYPIEVAILIEEEVHSWLIKPEENWRYWNKTAESLHGITRDILQTEGKSVFFVAGELNRLLKNTNGILYSDAVNWDGDWLNTLFFAAKTTPSFHMVSVYDLFDKDQEWRFNEARILLSESGKYRQHRAEEDVRMIYQAFLKATSC